MKSKELIRLLQELDPSGEVEVSVGNTDIYLLEKLPSYWDGLQEVLIRDENNKHYNVIGAKLRADGAKIRITPLSIREAIENDTILEVDYSDLPESKVEYYRESFETCRQENIAEDVKFDLSLFFEFCRSKFKIDNSELSRLEKSCEDFYSENLHPNDPMPEDVKLHKGSYMDRRNIQWEREIEVKREENGTFVLRKK